MRLRIVLPLVVCAVAGCHSTTAPITTQTWDYEAPTLTDGQVTCTFGAPMTVTGTSGPFTGTFLNGYMSCSGPNGASSTLESGTVDSGAVAAGAVGFVFNSTDIANSGEVSEVTNTFTNTGTIINNDTKMTGTATVTVTLDGVPYTLTGNWEATIE